MPRSNRPRAQGGARGPGRPSTRSGPGSGGAGRGGGPLDARLLGGGEVDYAGLSWRVRSVLPNDSGRDYLCPGCQHQVSAAVAHTVVWPAESMGGVENRRHWHTACWQARDRRRPGGSFA